MPRTQTPLADLTHPSWYAIKRGCPCEACRAKRREYNTEYVRNRRRAARAAATTTTGGTP